MAVFSPVPVASGPYMKLFMLCAMYIGIASTITAISTIGLIRFTTLANTLNLGSSGLCLVLSIRSDHISSSAGMKNITMSSEQIILLDMTIPKSKPILNCMSTSTRKPKKVVSELDSTVLIVVISPALSAGTLSRPPSRSLSYALSRNIE